ncbi:hypothetical protein [Fervidibacter sacchari]
MPIKKPQQIVGFKYVGTSPITIIGLGELNPGDVVPVEKAKEIWGDDFAGSEVLVPWEGEAPAEPKTQGGES